MTRFKLSTLAAAVVLLNTGCSYVTQGFFIDEQRNAEVTENDIFGDDTQRIVYLDQNWDGADSLWFYNTTQGSNWMSYDLFLHLEQANSQNSFRSNANMNKYRYLVQSTSADNPNGLPVGFVKDEYEGKAYIGFTCAACHTNQVDFEGTGIRVDGGPAMSDMETMLADVETALNASLNDADKLTRLAKLLQKSEEETKLLLIATRDAQSFYNSSNTPIHNGEAVPYGYARLDAFGRIYNRILSHLTPEDKTNYNSANAPVSYPFLWDTPRSNFVQWNGVGDNNAGGLAGRFGPLGRNVGEVLGVFGTFNLKSEEGEKGFRSSVNIHNLQRLERHLWNLDSPKWPENVLPKIDQELAAKGSAVYQEYSCGWCHNGGNSPLDSPDVFKHDDSSRHMVAQFASKPFIQSDWQMAQNALSYNGKSGYFNGETIVGDEGDKFGDKSPVLPLLSKAAKGVIAAPDYDKSWIRRKFDSLYLIVSTLLSPHVPDTVRYNDFEVVEKGGAMLNVYKGRTLNGIWATAPYLHNGSVLNLSELFMPSCSDAEIDQGKECRSKTFTVGSRSFDAKNVGMENKDKAQYPDLFVFDTTKPSNSNKGHEFAAGVTPMIRLDAKGSPVKNAKGEFETFTLPAISTEDRVALVEYLKTL